MTLVTSCPPRFGTKRSPDRLTLGPAVGAVAQKLGKPFMPWQQTVADVVLEIDPETGRLAYQEFGLTVPRQSGKSTFVLAKAVHRASATGFFGERQRIVYTAQTRQKAREKWEEDYAADLEASKVFASRIKVHKGNGNEHIRFANGSRFGIEANTEKAGHGGTLDEAYIDEAFAQPDNRLEQAFRPAMITRANKQLGWISTAGWLGGSPYLSAKQKMGRAAVEQDLRRGVAYFEWSADEDADPADPAVWRDCMPALGFTIDEEAIRAEFDGYVLSERMVDFRRAFLNQVVSKDADEEPVMPGEAWAASLDERSRITSGHRFAVDVSPTRSWSSIGVAGATGERIHVELTGRNGDLDHRPGTAWVVPRLVEMRESRPDLTVTIAAGAGAESLVPDLEDAGFTVEVLSGRDVMAACGLMFDLVTTDRLRQIGQPSLTAALVGARRKETDNGFTYARRKSTQDITPLYAVTLAAWAARAATTVETQFYNWNDL
jgi:phage terminase large subunit-like protein